MTAFIFALFMFLVSIVATIWFFKVRKSIKDLKKNISNAQNEYDTAPRSEYGSRNAAQNRLDNLKVLHSDHQFALKIVMAVAGVAFVVGGVTLALDTVVQVPARNVGVVNEFGNTTDTLSNGLHVVAPWASVEDVDTTNKPIQLTDDGNVDNGCTSIAVRLSTQTTACQDVFVQWQIDPKGDAKDLWKTYRGSNDDLIDNIQNNVILPRLRSEMQRVFSTYDPLAVLQGGKIQDTTTLQPAVEEALKADMPDGVLLLDLRFSQIHYDNATQNRINAFSGEVGNTRIAQQAEQTALAQAQANKDLAADPSINNPGVQYQNCLNMINNLAAKGQLGQLPQGFSCSQGGSIPIIVQTK